LQDVDEAKRRAERIALGAGHLVHLVPAIGQPRLRWSIDAGVCSWRLARSARRPGGNGSRHTIGRRVSPKPLALPVR